MNKDGSDINRCDTDPKLTGLRRCFLSLVDVHRYFSPVAYCSVATQDRVDNYLPIAHEYFLLFLYKSVGALLLHVLHKKMVLLVITVRSNIAAYALKTKRYSLAVNHSSFGLYVSENYIVNEALQKSVRTTSDLSSRAYTISAPHAIGNDASAADGELRFPLPSAFLLFV